MHLLAGPRLGAFALAATVGCGGTAAPEDSGMTRASYAQAVSAQCARLGAEDSDDPRVAAGHLERFRDEVVRLSPPAADRAAVRDRFLGPLDRMLAANRDAAGLSTKPDASQAELDAAVAKLDEADRAFAVMQEFFRDFGIPGCDR